MNSWILLERPAAQLKTLYSLAPHPDTQRLFAETLLNSATEHSPLLISLNGRHALHQAIEQNPAQWPGLQIDSTFDTPSVLTHLRQILIVKFDRQRMGVLRYSHPTVASYLFPACTAQDRSQWLGPINCLRWFGAQWSAKTAADDGWNQLENPDAKDWTLERSRRVLSLSAAQEQALMQLRNERFDYDGWQQHPGHSFAHASLLLDEALPQGIDHSETLAGFLSNLSQQAQS